MSRKKRSGYRIALSGVRGLVRILLYLLAALFILYAGRSAYRFGYDVFNERAMAKEPGKGVILVIPEDTGTRETAQMLRDEGLIADVNVFLVQERLSAYHGMIKPGRYVLRTSMTPTQILEIISGTSTEGQPEETEGQE